MKLKSMVFSGMLAASMAVSTFANETLVSPLPQFTMQDAQTLFEQDAKPMQLAALSSQEMKETEGAWFNFATAGWGAFGGGMSYATSTWASGGRWNWPAFGGSVVGGAVGGFFINPALGATVGAGVGGAISGWSSRWK